MKDKNRNIRVILFVGGVMAVLLMLVLGIREDFLMLEAVMLGGTGIILLLLKKPAWIIYLQILYCCVNKFLISQFSMPSAINYITDALMILSFLLAIKIFCQKFEPYYFSAPIFIAVFFFVCGTLSALFQQVDFLLLVWSYRNLMRFYIFFFSCVVLLDFRDVQNMMRLFAWVFHANILSVTFQFWIQGYSQDNLGGLFGTQMGCNGYMNTFLCIYLSYVCITYMSKKISFKYFFFFSAGSLYIAALSELKFLFVEYIVILIVSAILSRFSVRVVLMAVGACIGLYAGIQLFEQFFPGWEFSIDQVIEYAGQGGYSTENDLNRLTAIQRISSEFLHGIVNQLFGFGLGSCETSSFFNSSFFVQYGETLHYTYLLHAFLFLETGFVGLFLYLGFYICISIKAVQFRKYVDFDMKPYCEAAAIASLTCILQSVYNNALRVENSGYLAYLILAIPFICMKDKERLEDAIEKDDKSKCNRTCIQHGEIS